MQHIGHGRYAARPPRERESPHCCVAHAIPDHEVTQILNLGGALFLPRRSKLKHPGSAHSAEISLSSCGASLLLLSRPALFTTYQEDSHGKDSQRLRVRQQ
ncbi:hypothetical protein LJR290_000107 [Variovorax sp. LjRoot290]|uniref:hypothetical protein n=1 Tax=unclassified Variovorax TaxID=663243 RepID=UPI003ECD8035